MYNLLDNQNYIDMIYHILFTLLLYIQILNRLTV